MRLNWFAPASGPAARAAAVVLPALRRRAEVVVWPGRPGAAAWDEINRAAASVCHVDAAGGDGTLGELLRYHPGIVVFHEGGEAPAPFPPPLGRLAEEAAAVVVHSLASYADLDKRRWCPVIYRPAPGEGRPDNGPDAYVRDLLYLVGLVRRNRPAAASQRLATRAGAEMGAWVSGLADERAYRRIAEAIHDLTAATAPARPGL